MTLILLFLVNSHMDHKVFIVFIHFVFSVPSSYLLRHYHYVNLKMTWANAQQYCRAKYTDLAIFKNMNQVNRLNRPNLDTALAWIGLRDDPTFWMGVMSSGTNSWRWSATGNTSATGYQNWLSVTAPNEKSYVFISPPLTWANALNYCRLYYTDLAIIESADENIKVRNKIPFGYEVWIGLYRDAWTWADNSRSLFTNWPTGEPNNAFTSQYCVAETALHQWNDENCQNMYAFICHQDDVLQTTVAKMKIQTSANMADPAINAQLLQQIGEVLNSQGLTGLKLQWKIQPMKLEKLEIQRTKSSTAACLLQ
ncbi:macrophage mannose receptor 1-like [Mastacembelus armatus]|uniref:macrophage mannose receptor 1-like n=1 Tax=Mastacembelus armatus TaxID=205130 RepID=UPI000E45763F|nr:macrophage mannose receptor 1-like [Mastacembelus armatus]